MSLLTTLATSISFLDRIVTVSFLMTIGNLVWVWLSAYMIQLGVQITLLTGAIVRATGRYGSSTAVRVACMVGWATAVIAGNIILAVMLLNPPPSADFDLFAPWGIGVRDGLMAGAIAGIVVGSVQYGIVLFFFRKSTYD